MHTNIVVDTLLLLVMLLEESVVAAVVNAGDASIDEIALGDTMLDGVTIGDEPVAIISLLSISIRASNCFE